MSDSAFNRELAIVLNRLSDRFLPPQSVPENRKEKFGLWISAFVGTLFWGSIVLLSRILPGILESFYQTTSILTRPETWKIWSLGVLVLIICVMFFLLIVSSFKRGRSLTYFFWGLTFPSLAIAIVRKALD